jgi:transcriptional regulator with XRE-family HTH domain
MQEDGMSYGPRLRAHREHKGITQAMIAERMKITQPEVARFERGEPKRPSPEQFRALARAYELPLVQVLVFADYVNEKDIRGWVERDSSSGSVESDTGAMPIESLDDPVALIEQIAALTDRLDRLMRGDQESRERLRNTAAQG